MDAKNIAKQINKFDEIGKTYYSEEGVIWVVLESVDDIVYCEPFPKVDGISYNIVDDTNEVPSSASE